jgi:RNA polymerase sigma-70 factor (ECF subfamily)
MIADASSFAFNPWGGRLGRPADFVSLAIDLIRRTMAIEKDQRLEDVDDADLARRISGSTDARAEEAELCRRYMPRLRLYGLRHLGAEDRAEDLAQDVLLIALAKLRSGEVREPDRVGSFILGIARMRSKSSQRTYGRDGQPDDSFDQLPQQADDAPDPIARGRLARCLEALNARQQAIVVLTYYGEQSTRDIASSLGLSTNNVRVTRHRSIARLRECLGLELEEAA